MMRVLLMVMIVALCFTACKKSSVSDRVPPVTTAGKMTFGCIMNGNAAYVVGGNLVDHSGGWNITCTTGILARFFQGAFTLSTWDCPSNEYQFNLVICDSAIYPGVHLLGNVVVDSQQNIQSNSLTVSYVDDQGTMHWCETDSIHTGQLTLLRASDSIYAATFSAQLAEPGTNNILTISNGRFDVKLN